MQVMGKILKEREFTVEADKYCVKAEIVKTSFGWMLKGKIKGKAGRIEIFRTESFKKAFLNNWQSWGPCKLIDTEEFQPISPDRDWQYSASPVPELLASGLVSDYFVAGHGRLYGFLTSKFAHPFFTFEGHELVAYLEYFDTDFEDYVPLESFVFIEDSDNYDLLIKYAELVAQENNAQFKKDRFVGWCSWYHYFLDLTWPDVLKNLKLAKRYPIKIFQIDDGYEADIGDWLDSKDGFPSLDEMARTILQSGFEPGIWTAPFSVSETSKLFEKHPDWVVKENGKPKLAYRNWNRNIYALDLSREDVKQWLYELFSSLRRMGFSYFKIDFLFAGALPGERQRSVSPIQALREGLKIVREAVKDGFVLGCGSPLIPAVGFVDGMRIGPDTAPYWGEQLADRGIPAAKWALRNAITRSFMNRRLWQNDPDCLLLRTQKTKLSENERKLYAYTCGALDNMIVLSDDLSLYDDSSNEILQAILQLLGGEVKVSNIFNEEPAYHIESFNTKMGNFRLDIDLTNRTFELKRF
ncbi:alpha-galactosidase [Thermotoga sp. Ku-13t]|uniref:glycoside hydrolase family 36 protein n=1 Tax=Thermotoga sp. Ku-13t TaxID=1755813 RepID=UPI0013E9EFD0|nr:alpha-galactosidase [Thermotoga sp. Ku-13t]KAF2957177.1 alpha-galactosidase [Thermotoga sp. Ku-13t]